MPYYRWHGINLLGNDCKGTMLARNEDDVAHKLLKNDIGFMRAKKFIPGSRWQPVHLNQRAHLFRQYATLLESGIYIDQACLILINQIKHKRLKTIIEDVHLNITNGTLLAEALSHYPSYFSAVVLQVIASGQESGTLVQGLFHLADYYEVMHSFSKKIRSVLIAPLITFCVFLVVATIIIMVIIPGFSTLFISAHQELPYATQCVLQISTLLREWFAFIGVLIISLIGALWYGIKQPLTKKRIDAFMIRLPFIGPLITATQCLHMCTSLSLLMQGGVQLVPALELVKKSLRNEHFITLLEFMYDSLNQGNPLSTFLKEYPSLFPEDVQALIAVGYEANCLPAMLTKAGGIYQQKIEKKLSLISTLIQPLLMIILGLLVTGLIFVLYLPIFNLSFVIY